MKRPIWLVVSISAFIFAAFSFLRPADALEQTQISSDPLHPVEVFRSDASARSLSEAFELAGVEYYPEDRVSYFPDPELGLGSIITIERALPIALKDGKRSYLIRTWQNTVGDLLNEKKIALGVEDRISPSSATPLQPNLLITITRVDRTTVKEFETVTYKTIEQDDPSAYRGNNTVVQQGSSGQLEKQYLVIREDGEQISKTLTATITVKEVVNKIVKIGTKLKIGKVGTGKATWYPYPNRWGTKVASDFVKAGYEVRVTNLANGKTIIVRVAGCIVICPNGIVGTSSSIIDLAPEYFAALGVPTSAGVFQAKVEEILP